MELETCIEKLEALYEKDLKITAGCADDDKLALLPDKLKELYANYQSIKTPFGRIYSIDECLKMSQKEPFKTQGWFCFGQDEYFSFWLCKSLPDKEGLSFATWDHEMKEDIDEAAFANICDLLLFLSDEYMVSELATMCSVSVSGYCKDAMKEMMSVKKAFHSPKSMLELKEKAAKGNCMIKETFHYYLAKKIVRELDLKYMKVTLKKKNGWY